MPPTTPLPDATDWLGQIVGPYGGVAALLIFITGLVRKWWVLGWQYELIVEYNKRLLHILDRESEVAEIALGDIEKKVTKRPRERGA